VDFFDLIETRFFDDIFFDLKRLFFFFVCVVALKMFFETLVAFDFEEKFLENINFKSEIE